MHADRGRGEGVVGREDEGAPVLALVVRSVFGAGEDVVPPARMLVVVRRIGGRRESYSRMLDSEGRAVMYGGGFALMVWYSRVNWKISLV